MARTFRCARCGAEQQAMRLPDDWSPEDIAAWCRVESRFLCDDCQAAVAPVSA